MTTVTENKQKNANVPFKNVKSLNAALGSGESIPELIDGLRTLKRRLDAVLGEQLQKRRQLAENEAAKEALKRESERPAPPPPPEKKTVSIIRDTGEDSDGDKAIAAKNQKSARADFDAAARTAHDSVSHTGATAAASDGQPRQNQGAQSRDTSAEDKSKDAAASKPAASRPPATIKTYTPSYIRGEVVPAPPRPPAAPYQRGAKPPYPPRSGQSTGDYGQRPSRPGEFRPGGPGGAGRPFPSSGAGGTGRPFPPRPAGGAPRPLGRIVPTAPPPADKRKIDKKKDHPRGDSPKTLNKRTLIRKGFITENLDEDRMGSRKLKAKKTKFVSFVAPKIEKAIITTPNLTVKILSEKIGKTAQEIIKQLMLLGIMTHINSVVDFPTMELVANELGVGLELKLEQTKESLLEEQHDEADKEESLVKRPPIVTVMGHVDHGKTSLLDAIRKTSVVTGEAGGITQHIGAYSVTAGGEKITFLDTPGHEAFTELRKRGANVTDIAVLIVAADDGVMPQTIEALSHAKAAKVPILVAINKIDKPAADIEKIRQELTAHELIPEEWGGDTIMVPISAKRGDGIDKLLEMILFLAEYHNFRANPDRNAKASVIEAKLDRGKGPVANIIVQNGTLHVGDFIVSGMTCGRVRAMVDDKGRNIKEAPPSTPVSILGLDSVPEAGEGAYVVDDEKMAKQIIEERNTRMRNLQTMETNKRSLEDIMGKINEGLLKELNIILKADVHGSAEALKISLGKLVNEEVRVNVIHSGVGAINKSDIMLAEVSHAVVIGFNVRPDSESKTLAEKEGISIKLYEIIYEAIDDVERMMKGMQTPKYREIILGRAQVRNVFKLSDSGMIAGCYVLDGKVQRGASAKIYRGGEIVHRGTVTGLKRFKDDVKEVSTGFECGINVGGYDDIKELDEIEVCIQELIKT